MEGEPRRRDRGRIAGLVALAAGIVLFAAPAMASAETETFRIPITVGGYQVKQTVEGGAPRPTVDGHITNMSTDIVDADCVDATTCAGTPVPISRLMLHHIVFLNQGRFDQTCSLDQGILGFDTLTSSPPIERFFAAGEERARMAMPPGYGYDMGPRNSGAAGPGTTGQNHAWHVLYMVMNHKAETDSAYIEYTVTYTPDSGGTDSKVDAVPFWMDAENCQADPIYNVPGTGEGADVDENVRDFTLNPDKFGATGGRIVAGGGHVHGGAYRLKLSQPSCADKQLFSSEPTWGNPDHPFYNVKPILHEPGPINMTAFESAQGFPVRANQPLRLSSVYDDTRPHTRVMGIMILYIARDDSVPADPCPLPAPTDVLTRGSETPGRTGEPPEFKVPLTGLDDDGNAIKISKPPGKTEWVKSGSELKVVDTEFKKKNVKIKRGDELNWVFASDDIHNVTLANGPEGLGSPNLSRDLQDEPREFSAQFKKAGTYRFFCGLHPTQMAERVVVEK